MPDQHVTQMDGYRQGAADLPQTVWQMTAAPDVAEEVPAEVAPDASPIPTPEVPTEQPAPVAAAEQE